jgi:O-antigen ligase
MIFGASLAWFLSKLNNKEKVIVFNWRTILLGLMSFVFFISLIIGQSRGAFGIAVILGLSLIILLVRKIGIKIIGVMAILFILASTVLLNVGIVQKQINNQENHNVLAYRDRVWNVSIEASRFYPLLGIGLSNWHFITLEQLKKSVEARAETFDPNYYFFPGHSHNIYLSALVERGIVGLIVTLLFMIMWIKQLIKTYDWAAKTQQSIRLWAGSLSAWVATFGTRFTISLRTKSPFTKIR